MKGCKEIHIKPVSTEVEDRGSHPHVVSEPVTFSQNLENDLDNPLLSKGGEYLHGLMTISYFDLDDHQ